MAENHEVALQAGERMLVKTPFGECFVVADTDATKCLIEARRAYVLQADAKDGQDRLFIIMEPSLESDNDNTSLR